MKKTDVQYCAYVQTLKEELIPAMGCTEPIALAYAAAVAKETLGTIPDTVTVSVSGSIIKNVKSVIVPHTDGLKGIPAAVSAGIIAGQATGKLEVLSCVNAVQIEQIKEFMQKADISIEHIDNGITFDIIVTLCRDTSYCKVRIANYHTNIVLIEKNGTILKQREITADTADFQAVLERQMQYNWAIAEEGLKGNYGANIGKVLMTTAGNYVAGRAKAMAAAGSDARMNGCEMPVIINSGSDNQGITVSVPLIVYAQELKTDKEQLLRALALSNLTAIHVKTPIGRLSAYCGAVNAGVGAGAGIAYLCGGGYDEVIHTVVNALAIISGIICDGAKASCAAKIASSIEAGIFGYSMYVNGQQFYSGDGIVTQGIEATLKNVGRLGKDGMRETNEEIIKMMMGK